MGEVFITRRGGGKAATPSIFGNGSDGVAVISGTVNLPVVTPHQSIVEKQYKSLTINAGAILKCNAHNAGLIIRVQEDCTIYGTIDQSGLAPKTNTQNNYPYPAQLVCGNGGDGGVYSTQVTKGIGMLKRPYGGGYGGGGAGGRVVTNYGSSGGDSTGITINVSNIFVGGNTDTPGTFGGGGGGRGPNSNGGAGGGGNGSDGSEDVNAGAGGGAGNYGGGIILLYVGGDFYMEGRIYCNGLKGGNGGGVGSNSSSSSRGGHGGGGGGGGAVYIYHRGVYLNTGTIQVNGGSGGEGGQRKAPNKGEPGIAGGVGSITVIKHAN